MKTEETLWHIWAMRALTSAGGSGAALDTLEETRERIEEQTEGLLADLGMAWTAGGGLGSVDGKPVPNTVYEAVWPIDLDTPHIEALLEAYYGSPTRPPFTWSQDLHPMGKRAARTLGPVLQELLQQAISWRQFEQMAPKVRDQVKAELLKEDDHGS